VKLIKWKANIVLNYWKEKHLWGKNEYERSRGQYSNNRRLGVYIQMIKRGVDKCAINKVLEL